MKEHKDIDQKIAAYLNGTHTEQEKLDVEAWMAESNENAFQIHQLRLFWEERTADLKLIDHDNQKSKIWSAHQNRSASSPQRRQRFFVQSTWVKIAASILILIIPTILIYQRISDKSDILAQIEIPSEIVKYNPSGQKSQIKLPDGSTVWLNAESKLTYSGDFSASVREVKLEGEAFFEIKSDTLRPFYIDTESLQVSVLGTGFNVSAYKDDKSVTVALIHGSVKVLFDNEPNKDMVLSPGNALTYSKDTKIHETTYFANDQLLFNKYNSWKYGALIFDGQDFEGFVKKLSRWYGLEVSVSGVPPKDWLIRASFENEYLNNLLDAISFNKEFNYELNDKKLKLKFN